MYSRPAPDLPIQLAAHALEGESKVLWSKCRSAPRSRVGEFGDLDSLADRFAATSRAKPALTLLLPMSRHATVDLTLSRSWLLSTASRYRRLYVVFHGGSRASGRAAFLADRERHGRRWRWTPDWAINTAWLQVFSEPDSLIVMKRRLARVGVEPDLAPRERHKKWNPSTIPTAWSTRLRVFPRTTLESVVRRHEPELRRVSMTCSKVPSECDGYTRVSVVASIGGTKYMPLCISARSMRSVAQLGSLITTPYSL